MGSDDDNDGVPLGYNMAGMAFDDDDDDGLARVRFAAREECQAVQCFPPHHYEHQGLAALLYDST